MDRKRQGAIQFELCVERVNIPRGISREERIEAPGNSGCGPKQQRVRVREGVWNPTRERERERECFCEREKGNSCCCCCCC